MTNPQIYDVAPRIQYLADGITTQFVFPFIVLDADDLVVYLGATAQTSGYIVNNVGNETGGTVVFATAPSSGVFVTLVRGNAVERLSDFQVGGILRSETINDELDRLTAYIQDLRQRIDRCIELLPYDEAADLRLQLAADRADKLLGFDAAGDVLLYDPASTGGGGGGGGVGIFSNLVAGADRLIAGIGNFLGIGGSGTAGVVVHSALMGLTADDHPQYLTDARGDARYSRLGHEHTGSEVTFTGTAGNAAVFDSQGKLVDGGIAPGGSGGGDMVRNVYDPDLNGIIGVAQGGTSANTAAGARFALGLAIGSDVAAQNHTHNLTALTDTSIAFPSNGQILTYDGMHWINADAGGGGGGNGNSGAVLRTWSASSSAYTTVTARTPMDNTIPQLAETAEFSALALTVTPLRSDSVIEVSFHGAIDAANECISASCIFIDADAQAVFAMARKQKYTGEPITGDFTAEFPSGSTTPRTYHFRFGTSTGTSLRFNGYGTALFGGVAKTLVTAREVVRS